MNNSQKDNLALSLEELSDIKKELTDIYEEEVASVSIIKMLSKRKYKEKIDEINILLGNLKDAIKNIDRTIKTLNKVKL